MSWGDKFFSNDLGLVLEEFDRGVICGSLVQPSGEQLTAYSKSRNVPLLCLTVQKRSVSSSHQAETWSVSSIILWSLLNLQRALVIIQSYHLHENAVADQSRPVWLFCKNHAAGFSIKEMCFVCCSNHRLHTWLTPACYSKPTLLTITNSPVIYFAQSHLIDGWPFRMVQFHPQSWKHACFMSLKLRGRKKM